MPLIVRTPSNSSRNLHNTGVGMSLLLLLMVHLTLTSNYAPWPVRIACLLETCVIAFCAFTTLNNFIFFLQVFILSSFHSYSYLQYLNQNLDRALYKVRRGFLDQAHFRSIVDYYREEYCARLLNAIMSNQHLVSGLIVATVGANFPLNIYLTVERFFSRYHSAGQILVDLMLLTIQSGYALLALVPILLLSSQFFFSMKRLFKVQFFIVGSGQHCGTTTHYCQTKLKLMSFLERTFSKKRFAFTMGPIGSITQMFLLEV